MSRFRTYHEHDDSPAPMVDGGMRGVNMRVAPELLPEQFAAEAVNMRFRFGVPETRLGHMVLPWNNKISSGNINAWSSVRGVGVFDDPRTGQQFVLIAANDTVFYTVEQNTPVEMNLPDQAVIDTDVWFTQAFDRVVMHRGANRETLVMNQLGTGWEYISQSGDDDESDGTIPIPNASRSVFFQNRLWIPNDQDDVAFSDIGDYTRYTILQEFRVNRGSSDRLLAIVPFNETTLIAFKEQSVWALTNIYGDLSAAQLTLLTGQFGCVAPNSIAQVGRDLWFLSQLGVMSIRQTEENRLQSVVRPVSEAIDPLIKRINWRHVANASAAYWDSRYYLAVPLDDAEVQGPELAQGAIYDLDETYTVQGLTAGATYFVELGASEASMDNGAQNLTNSGYFTAQGTTVTLHHTVGLVVTASLRRVTRGVNNAVLVFDFLNNAWAGHDETPGRDFARLFIARHQAVRRMFSYGSDGWVVLLEEDYEDADPFPQADLEVTAIPEDGDTLQVNGGTLITADSGLGNNTPTLWAVSESIDFCRTTLYGGNTNLSGYDTNLPFPWSAPNTQVVKLSTGVRFLSTNGVLPAIATTGSWATITERITLPIAAILVTRAYQSPGRMMAKWGHVWIDVQTWLPSLTITAVKPGVGESTTLVEAETRDRTKFDRPHHRADHDLTNVNDDFEDPFRQDYSVTLDGVGGSDGLILQDGVTLSHHQERRLAFKLNERERMVQLRIENSTGRVRVMGINIEGAPQPENERSHV